MILTFSQWQLDEHHHQNNSGQGENRIPMECEDIPDSMSFPSRHRVVYPGGADAAQISLANAGNHSKICLFLKRNGSLSCSWYKTKYLKKRRSTMMMRCLAFQSRIWRCPIFKRRVHFAVHSCVFSFSFHTPF